MKNKLCLVLVLTVLATAQQYLPKESDYLPMNNLYAKDICRSGRKSFWKCQKDGETTITSAYPIRPNAMTKVTFYLENGYGFNFGVGERDINILKSKGNIYYHPNVVLYSCGDGQKYVYQDGSDYSTRCSEGDNVTMTVDLRAYKNEVSFARNGLPLGIAFSGLNDWKDLYIMISIFLKDTRIKITDYSVE